MKSGIYKIINIITITNNIYIGSAIYLKSRKSGHFYNLIKNKHHNKKLQNSFNKHGKENFIFEVLEFCEKENLITREQHYLDTLKPKYNILKIAGSSLGRKRSLKERQENSLRKLGCVASNTKEVYQISLDGKILSLFSSTRIAMYETGVEQRSIATCSRRQQHSSGGFLWCYKSDLDNNKISIKQLVNNYLHSLQFLSHKNKNSKYLLKNVA